MLGIALAGGTMPIAATANTVFTWDPAGASPSVSAPAFTADTILGTHNLYDIGSMTNTYTVKFLEQITGFTLTALRLPRPASTGRQVWQVRTACI
jgi:hypothetical protein